MWHKETIDNDIEREEGNGNTYISWDDRTLPIEFDRDITNCDIVLKITDKDWEVIFRDEKEMWSHVDDKSTVFEVSRKKTSEIKEWEYKRSVTVYDNDTDKKVSTKPECFYVE